MAEPKDIKQVRLTSGNDSYAFTVGKKGYHDKYRTAAVTGGREVAKTNAHGKEVWIASAEAGAWSFASFRGDYHDLLSIFGGTPSPGQVKSVYDKLTIVDSPGGMTVNGARSTLWTIVSHTTLVTVPGYGHILVGDHDRAKAMLPKYAGQRTTHGEIWRVPLTDRTAHTRPGDHSYVVASSGGVAEVFVAPYSQASDAEQLTWLKNIKIG
ncbi:hypothetical protein [Pilimelia terevasa]|uniref:hypothetical protein n=1 Tax=Pilimelia terevasa TaxID=53372 RepID=UPI001664D924|nr:hypothetical protein [Pilimelia terevasa]